MITLSRFRNFEHHIIPEFISFSGIKCSIRTNEHSEKSREKALFGIFSAISGTIQVLFKYYSSKIK